MGQSIEGKIISASTRHEGADLVYFGVGQSIPGYLLARMLHLGEVTSRVHIYSGMFRSLEAENRASREWTKEDFEKNLPKGTTHVSMTINAGSIGMMDGIAWRLIDARPSKALTPV